MADPAEWGAEGALKNRVNGHEKETLMSETKTSKTASRRDFLKTTAAVGAATVGGLALARSAHAAGS